MKKIIIGFLAFICIVATVYAATKDSNPPVLKSLSVSNQKNSYSIGDKLYLNIDANDDISGISSITVFLAKYIDDPLSNNYSFGGSVEVHDVNGKPYIIIPDNYYKGNYTIDQISLYDNNGNTSHYSNIKSIAGERMGILMNYLNYSVDVYIDGIDNSIYNDSEYPELIDIQFEKNTLNYGETIKITAHAVDLDSGIKDMLVSFKTDDMPNAVQVSLSYDKSSDSYIGYMKCPYPDGKYYLSWVSLDDNSGKINIYYPNEYNSYYTDYMLQDFTLTVKGNAENTPKVTFEKAIFDYRKVVTPSVFKISLKINDTNNLVKDANIGVGVKDLTPWQHDKIIEAFLTKDDEGLLTGYIDLNQYVENGEYYLKEISLYDLSIEETPEEREMYFRINNELEFDEIPLFEVVSTETFDVVSSTTDKDLINKIAEASDNAKIAINAMNDSLVKKEVFEAISSTNKQIYIESEGITWVFNGMDIKNPKDINVATYIGVFYDSPLNEELENYIEKGLVITFADNGELPGKALIKIKSDYTLRNYLGIDGLSLYYYNENADNNELFDYIANKLEMNEDGYYEFYIDHNSTYILSNKTIADEYVVDKTGESEVLDKDVSVKKNNKKIIIICVSAVIVVAGVTTAIVIKKRKNKKQ